MEANDKITANQRLESECKVLSTTTSASLGAIQTSIAPIEIYTHAASIVIHLRKLMPRLSSSHQNDGSKTRMSPIESSCSERELAGELGRAVLAVSCAGSARCLSVAP